MASAVPPWSSGFIRFPSMGWWDLLDILVASAAIYELLKLIRGTRAVQMVLGCGVLVGLYYASQQLGLQTVNWMVRNVAGYVVFAAIVLFQSDIRRALAQLGQTPFIRYFADTRAREEVIEELTAAAAALSAQKVGALIAVERETGLRNYSEGGIPVDASLTWDLLVCIFQPNGPLHDGAAIIQNDRIASAACFLPLTTNPFVGKGLGTRHRAAIGLTEESDAVCIIVSEETGRISLAVDGRIDSGLSSEQLRERLRVLRPGSRVAKPEGSETGENQ
jgi:diadenylate cyclase